MRPSAAGEGQDRIAGDARQNGAAERRGQHRAVVEDEEHVHAAELLDPAPFGGVEKDDLVAAVPDRLGLGDEARGVIAAAFGGAGAAGRGAGVVGREPDADRLLAALEIGADGRGDHHEPIFRRRADAEKGLVGEHERAQVEAAVAARDPFDVGLHQLLDGAQERRLGQHRHRQALGGGLEAAGVLLGAEQGDAAVLETIGLEALENLLGVVQHGARRIEDERLARPELRVAPAALLRPADGRHVIGEDSAEAGILEHRRPDARRDRRRMGATGENGAALGVHGLCILTTQFRLP